MFKFFKRLFIGSSEKNNNLLTEETIETKKCLNCLRRVKVQYVKCPHCGKDNFEYDS